MAGSEKTYADSPTFDEFSRRLGQLRRSVVEEVGADHLSDEQLSGYVFGSLPVEDAAWITAHIEGCGRCMKSVMRLRAHRAEIELANDQHGNGGVVLLDAARQAKSRRRTTMGWSALAAAGIGAVAVYLGGLLPQDGQITQVQLAMEQAAPNSRPFAVDYAAFKTDWLTLPVTQDGVDWYGGFIEATASGTVDMSKMNNRVQAEIVAETTARHLAYAELAEIIGGVRVAGDTAYADLLLKVSELKVETEGFVRDARVVAKTLEWVGDVPKATVTLRVPLQGKEGLGALAGRYRQSVEAVDPRAQPAAAGDSVRLLVDARNIGYQPALALALSAGVGGEQPVAVNFDDVVYVPASQWDGLAAVSNPIRASRTNGPGSLLLTAEDLAAVNSLQSNSVAVIF